MVEPILRSIPCFVVGIPVALAILVLTLVTPNARFKENETPGILILSVVIMIIYQVINSKK